MTRAFNTSQHDIPLTVTVLDTVTGERRTQKTEFATFWWSEHNGGCDCNRQGMFFPEHDPDWLERGYCIGCVRYRIVTVEPLLEGYTLADFNEGYPEPPGGQS